MRIALTALCFSLLSTAACQNKKFAGGTKNGVADALPEAVAEEESIESEPIESLEQPKPPSKEIEFGAAEFFRIGDGNSGANSACIGEVKSHELKGTTYYFQFEVLENDSKIDVSIGKLCGVDSANFTTVSLQDAAKNPINAEVVVPIDASGVRSSPYAPLASQSLKKGIYSIVVTSKNKLGRTEKSPDPNADEFDDFVVGNIQIKSNKTVKQIKVFAE